MRKNLYKYEKYKKYYSPLVRRECILETLRKFTTPVRRQEIAKILRLTKEEELESLRCLLSVMEDDGQLVLTDCHGYALPEQLNLFKGTVIGHRDGFGFLQVAGQKEDFYLSLKEMKKALHGDVVLAQPLEKNQKGRIGLRIIRVLIPRDKYIVGRYFLKSGIGYVVPNDTRLPFNILIAKKQFFDVKVGNIVLVEMTARPEYDYQAIGNIIEVLGENMTSNIAVEIALRNYKIPYLWNKKVKKQVAYLSKKKISRLEKRRREDLCHFPLVTIDSDDARDFDDAVFCIPKENGGWSLWVAIADVSYYVRPKTALDNEAINRGNSLYFPSRVIPMFPEIISNELCSLNPGVERLCMVCEMQLSSTGKIISSRFYEAVIRSRARLTYTTAWKILQGDKELRKDYQELVPHLEHLYRLYKILDNARIKRGAVSFETEEAKFIFNTQKRIERIEVFERNDVHKLIEECMILTNTAAADFINKHKEPILYRVHDSPKKENVINLQMVLNKLGLTLSGGIEPQSVDYAKIMNEVSTRPDYKFLKIVILRSMEKAIYNPKNRGHFALALRSYVHFTSPIRRYSDLAVHRSIKYLVSKKDAHDENRSTPNGGWHADVYEMLQLSQHCSMTERRADEAIRDVIDWLKCDFMQERVGNVFIGVIISITNFGFFVRLKGLFIDGLVHLSSLNGDYYHRDGLGQSLTGRDSGIVYHLGDEVKIRVKSVDMDERKITFSLMQYQPIITPYKRENCSVIKKLK